MKKTQHSLCFFLTLFVCLGCNKSADFLYYSNPKPANIQTLTRKIKEIQGESKVDILWVVDNSGSMDVWQQSVISNLDSFINTFVSVKGLQWKMGLVSTDTLDDPYIGFTPTTQLDYKSANPASLFSAAIRRLGTFGDGVEKIFLPIKLKLTQFPDFTRKDALLAIIVLTDTEDQSNEDRNNPIDAPQLVDFLKTTKGSLDRVITYAILGAIDLGCSTRDDWGDWDYKTSRHKQLVDATHGKAYKLCDPNFGANLVDIGNDFVKHVTTSRLNLTSRPRSETIHVFYKQTELPGGPKDKGGYWLYDFDLNAIIFHDLDFAQGDSEEVTVRYEDAN